MGTCGKDTTHVHKGRQSHYICDKSQICQKNGLIIPLDLIESMAEIDCGAFWEVDENKENDA